MMKHIFLSLCLAAAAALTTHVQAGSLDEVAARNAALPDYAALHKLVENTQKPMLWLFEGDSITHGSHHTKGYRSYAEHWQEIVKWELYWKENKDQRCNDIIVNAAVSGATATECLAQADWRLKQFRPQVVFFNFGVNDIRHIGDLKRYRADLTALVNMARRKGAIPVLMVPSLCLNPHPRCGEYERVVREIADKEKILLVDHGGYWREVANQGDSAPRAWMSNGLHPNELGHRVMAQTMAKELGIEPKPSVVLTLPH